MPDPREFKIPVVQRSQLMLEVASALVDQDQWKDKQVEIRFRPQGLPPWRLCLFASDAPNAIDAVMNGEADIAICNPGGVLAMARAGVPPFKQACPLVAIAVLPQFDQLGFAVAKRTGLDSLRDIKEKKYPLRVSLRGQPDHSVHFVTNQVLASYGFSLEDITAWGGELRYTAGMPNGPQRLGAVARGELDAVFDEAVPTFGAAALAMDMRFLPVDEPELQMLDAIGLRRVAITPEEYPALAGPVWTVDFSGWPIFTRESTSAAIVSSFCKALEARKSTIPWYGQGPLDLKAMVSDTREAPMAIPLHPAAERYWRERGYLD
ncbi:MAG: hypothetical protein EXR28_15920 [Betaproteobacteria bacterium]|nr:hypothetical protein [Betaproteobacteria bacterium]